MNAHPIILYVEDNEDDRFLFRKASEAAQVSYQVLTVEHGKKAIDYLVGAGEFANRKEFPLPTLVLLDLKMPILDGWGVLHWIRKQPALEELPVVVFTSSYQHIDVVRGYEEGATAFLSKPAMLDDLGKVARALDRCFAATPVDCSALQGLPQLKRMQACANGKRSK